MAKAFKFEAMTSDDFAAKVMHEGDPCYLCESLIKKDQDIRYYGGPFVMHSSCVDKLLDHHGANEPMKPE